MLPKCLRRDGIFIAYRLRSACSYSAQCTLVVVYHLQQLCYLCFSILVYEVTWLFLVSVVSVIRCLELQYQLHIIFALPIGYVSVQSISYLAGHQVVESLLQICANGVQRSLVQSFILWLQHSTVTVCVQVINQFFITSTAIYQYKYTTLHVQRLGVGGVNTCSNILHLKPSLGLLVPCGLCSVFILSSICIAVLLCISATRMIFHTLHILLFDVTTWLQCVFIVYLHGGFQYVIEYTYFLLNVLASICSSFFCCQYSYT